MSAKSLHTCTLSVLALATVTVGGCTMIREFWEDHVSGIDDSLREPTGYYQHAEAVQAADRLRIPEGLEVPLQDRSMQVPPLPEGAELYPVGEDMDVRAPTAPLRSTLGMRTQWAQGEAIVWFQRGGAHGINDENDAMQVLSEVLEQMPVKIGEMSEDEYQITTEAADFNEFGSPYNQADYDSGALRYRQIYRLRIGRSPVGELGIATSLIGSMTLTATSQKNIADYLNPTEQQRFAMGFSNQIIKLIDHRATAGVAMPDQVNVLLDRDSNNRDCLSVDAPYERTWDALRAMLPKYNWNIDEYSLSNGRIKLDVKDQDSQVYHSQGVDSFEVEEGTYYIRLGVEGERSVITFYDKDDKPLPPGEVSRIYSGFAKALARQLTQ